MKSLYTTMLITLFLVSCRTLNDVPDRVVATSPGYWQSTVSSDGESVVISDSLAVIDGRDARTLEVQLTEIILRKTVAESVRDLVGDEERYREERTDIDRLFTDRWRRYVREHEVLQTGIYENETRLGMKIRVVVDEDRLKRDLETRGILRVPELRAVVVVRKAADGAAAVDRLASGYLDDLAQDLAGELAARGVRPLLWNDVRRTALERRQAGDQLFSDFMTQYIEESDRRMPRDERYALPMVLLRNQGRLLVGYTILELSRAEGVYHGTVRVDAYDLLNQTALGRWNSSGQEIVGSRSLLQTRQALVDRLSSESTNKLATAVGDFLRRETRLRERTYQLTFVGFTPDELDVVSSLLAGIVTENISPRITLNRMSVTCGINRAEIPARDEILRSLAVLGLESRATELSGTSMTFARKR